MECQEYSFSSHAIQRMFERMISKQTVKLAVQHGEVIARYPDDKPYPSYLILYFEMDRPIHVLAALEKSKNKCYIVTVYEPDKHIWEDDFRTRRKS